MDNQQDQAGATNPTNASRTPQNPTTASTSNPGAQSPAGSSAAASRKATPSASTTTDATSTQPVATAGAERQGEGQQTNAQEGTILDTALNSGKKWIEDSGVLNGVNQLPQNIKDFGSRAAARVGELSTTQKVVGGAILAVGLGWLALRKGKSGSSTSSPYNYGRQRDAGSYGRRSYGYQAPDASTSRKTASGASSRSDSGSPYGNSGSRYGVKSGSGRDTSGTGLSGSGFGASAATDHGAQASSHAAKDSFGSSSDE